MSIIRCADCNRLIDSDLEDDFLDDGDGEVVCSDCNEERDDPRGDDAYNDPRRGQAKYLNHL